VASPVLCVVDFIQASALFSHKMGVGASSEKKAAKKKAKDEQKGGPNAVSASAPEVAGNIYADSCKEEDLTVKDTGSLMEGVVSELERLAVGDAGEERSMKPMTKEEFYVFVAAFFCSARCCSIRGCADRMEISVRQ